MSRPLFSIGAAARLDISPGAASRAAYYALVGQYNFGAPVIHRRAPAELATTSGLTLLSGAADPGIAASIPCVIIVTTPYGVPTIEGRGAPTFLNPQGPLLWTRAVLATDAGGTLVGVNWVDANGVLWPDVDWEWQISVEGYTNIAQGDSGTFTQQVIIYTGNGVNNRQVPTTADLSKGVTVVMVLPQSGVSPTLATSAMIAAGKFSTFSAAPANTVGGVTALNATGFTVKDNTGQLVTVNQVGVQYTALVFNDTTGKHMSVGTYPGSDGITPLHSTGTVAPTMVWVTGRSGQLVYAEIDHMPAGGSVHWSAGEAKSLTTGITAINNAGKTFSTGNDNDVDNGALTYYWVAFNLGSTGPTRTGFDSFVLVGTAAAIDHVTGLAFTPVFAFARPYVAGVPSSCWRGPWNAGTTSQVFAAGGIESFAPGDIGIGNTTAPNGTTVYGFTLAGSGGAADPPVPIYMAQPGTAVNPFGSAVSPNTLQTSAPLTDPPPSGGAEVPGPPIPPATGAGNCPPCADLTTAKAILASRLQDSGMVHWTTSELTRYLNEALRTWNALTGAAQVQTSFVSQAGVPFYDLPVTLPVYRAYTITDTYLVSDLEYALMEPPTGGSWTGTPQFTFTDIVSALQQRRDQFLLESGMVVTRVVQTVAGPPASGRIPLHASILTLRRLAFIDAVGAVYPLQRDDEWGATGFSRGWNVVSGVPISTFPMAYSTGMAGPTQVQIIPPLSTVGTLDILAVTRAAVMGGTGPCLDPATGILLGVPDDWTWVVKWGALATLLNQQGVTYDPQRAAYCEARYRQGVQLALKASTVLVGRINDQVCGITSVNEMDQYNRSWQRFPGASASLLLAGQSLVGLAPPPLDTSYTVTLDLVRNAPIPAIGTDCLSTEDGSLEAVIGYAQHLALFKEGPTQLQQAMDLLDRFFRAAQIDTALELVASPNKQAILDQTRSDEAQRPRILMPPPIQVTGGAQ